jgi:hypothetical protein
LSEADAAGSANFAGTAADDEREIMVRGMLFF